MTTIIILDVGGSYLILLPLAVGFIVLGKGHALQGPVCIHLGDISDPVLPWRL